MRKWPENWWTQRDVELAVKARAQFDHIKPYCHHDEILGAPYTMLLARGLIEVKPELNKGGRPTAWYILPTKFGLAVKAEAERQMAVVLSPRWRPEDYVAG